MEQFTRFDPQIDALLSKMTLDQKAGQLNQIRFTGANFEEVAQLIREHRVGSLILAGGSTAGNGDNTNSKVQQLNALQKLALECSGIPLIVGRDIIHGHKTVYPIPLAMAATFNPELIRKDYEEIAQEASIDGVSWSFAPMLDVSRDPRWGRCIESPGEDPCLGGCMAEAVVRGFQGDDLSQPGRIAACAKHYVGYGAAEGGRDYNGVEIGDATLRNFYLKAFCSAVKAGAATVMSSFNAISGLPVSANSYLLRDVLKGEFGFDGYVISDWASIEIVRRFCIAETRKDCAQICLNAGIDMDMVDECYVDYAAELVREGSVSQEVLDEAVRRVLRVKFACGLFDRPFTEPAPVDYAAHLNSAIETAAQSLVLLKNSDHILPLNRTQSIAAVGPMLDQKRNLLGSWTLDFDLNLVKSIREVLREEYADVKIDFQPAELQDVMVMAAKGKDAAVVFLGESVQVTGEARCLSCVDVPEEQAALVRKLHSMGKKVIAVLCFGRPIALQNIEPYCDAILYAWHGGSGVAQAIARSLFGDMEPSGALPMTILRTTGQIPMYYNAYKTGNSADVYYDDWQNGYEDVQKTPLYPFGYGLSYTEFSYSGITVESLPTYQELLAGKNAVVSIEVTNTGSRDGYEIVQCYVRDPIARIARPIRELKGFRKLFLKAGETRKVTFQLGEEALGYYLEGGKFMLDPGKFEVYIGKSAYCKEKTELVF